jgi:hypothetical protein
MTKSSKLSKSTSSAEVKRLVKDLASRLFVVKEEADIILSKYVKPVTIEDADRLLGNILSKFHLVVREIGERHENRPTLEVLDEYDVQDLLHGLLRLCFDDIRVEEWTPEYAGSSARMDFLLKKEQIAIEVKKTKETS